MGQDGLRRPAPSDAAVISFKAGDMVQVSRYHPLLVGLHWILALFILAALMLGAVVLVNVPNTSPMKIDALRTHTVGGGLIVIFMIVRWFVRANTSHPAPTTACSPTTSWVSSSSACKVVTPA